CGCAKRVRSEHRVSSSNGQSTLKDRWCCGPTISSSSTANSEISYRSLRSDAKLFDDFAPLVRIRTGQCREFFGTRFGRLDRDVLHPLLYLGQEKTHGPPRCVERAALVGKTQCHRCPFEALYGVRSRKQQPSKKGQRRGGRKPGTPNRLPNKLLKKLGLARKLLAVLLY